MKETVTYEEAIEELANLKDNEIVKDGVVCFLTSKFIVATIFKTSFDKVENDVANVRAQKPLA